MAVADVRKRLVALGFKPSREQSFVRQISAAGIDHAVWVETMRGAGAGNIQLSLGVRHSRTEQCLFQFYRALGVAKRVSAQALGPGWTMGRYLGTASPEALSFETQWTGDGPVSSTSLMQAIERLDRLDSIAAIHDRFVQMGSLSATWILRDDRGWARHLLIAKQVSVEKCQAIDARELEAIRAGVSQDRVLGEFRFEQVFAAADEALTAPI